MSQESIGSSQSQSQSQDLDASDVFPANGGASSPMAQVNTSGLDDLLADIDSVLETNAQDFVSGFVQKGGQ
jgi:ubiquitin-like protein Pup